MEEMSFNRYFFYYAPFKTAAFLNDAKSGAKACESYRGEVIE